MRPLNINFSLEIFLDWRNILRTRTSWQRKCAPRTNKATTAAATDRLLVDVGTLEIKVTASALISVDEMIFCPRAIHPEAKWKKRVQQNKTNALGMFKTTAAYIECFPSWCWFNSWQSVSFQSGETCWVCPHVAWNHVWREYTAICTRG